MFCAISGVAPEEPVVSTKSGHLFERSVVEKYIESTGKCPVTAEPLELGDLLGLKSSTAVKPRPVAATSIPGMLTLLQNEWDALMLEQFTAKSQLDTVRQELGRALYEHDAACRVIARLIKERDDARAALSEARATAPAGGTTAAVAPTAPAGGAAPDAAGGGGITAEMQAKFDATAKTLSKGRKKRAAPAGYVDAAGLAAYSALGSTNAHKAGPTALDVHSSEAVIATGGADGSVSVLGLAASLTKRASAKAHKGRVTSVKLHPTRPLLVSASADGTTCVSSTANGKAQHTIRAHTAEVNGVTLHATGDFAVTASADRSWCLLDLELGSSVLTVREEGASGYTCAGFHPDGLILATGMGKAVRVWELKSQTNAATFDGHTGAVTSLAFSENGYYLATGVRATPASRHKPRLAPHASRLASARLSPRASLLPLPLSRVSGCGLDGAPVGLAQARKLPDDTMRRPRRCRPL